MTSTENVADSNSIIPIDNKEATFNFLKRNFNALNEPNIVTKKSASTEIYNFLQTKKYDLDSIQIEQIMNNFAKNILKAIADNVEKVRENSIKLLNFLLSRCQDFSPHLPYIIAIMVERTNCHDLEGIQDIPEIMRPNPSQKPHVHVNLAEPTEEIRLEYCETLSTIISCCNEDEIRGHINDIVNILRALAMDPCGEVQVKACQNISLLCRTFNSLLLHFSEILARAILLPLVNKKSKVRIAALEALGQILYCGVWKYNNTIMEILVGFRDPNSVAIQEFFEYTTKINYFAVLIKDSKTNVREFFIRCLGDWLISLPDRFDHEPRITPYLVSGLFDKDEEICEAAYEMIEEVGLQYEREKEKELRSVKQFGYDAEWTQGGKITNVKLPKPFAKRPRLGSRIFIRSHVRKFLPALYKEVKDWQFENRLEAINLLLFGLIYAEDYTTQFLDKFVINILHNLNIRNKDDQIIADKTCQIFHYIGVFCHYKAYLPLISSALKGEFIDNDDAPKFALTALFHLLTGFFETVIKEDGLKGRKDCIHQVIDLIGEEDFVSSIDKDTAPIVEQIMELIYDSLLNKCTADDLEEFYKEKRFKAQFISYTALRYRLVGFEDKVAKKSLEQDYKSDLASAIQENILVKSLLKIDEIFEDLLLESFAETFHQETCGKLSSTQWKIIYTYFMININTRATQGSKYDDNLLKTLELIKGIDFNSYAKPADILQMSLLMIKLIADSFSDQEFTQAQSTFLFHAINLNCKVHDAVQKNQAKLPGFQEKLLVLGKIFFSRNISWVDAAQKLDGKADSVKELGGDIAELVYLVMETTLKKQENTGKEFKNRLQLFKTILGHLGLFILKKSRYLKTSENKYLVPELIDYLMFLHQKFSVDDPEDVLPLLFESLFLILTTIPDSVIEPYKGEQWIIKDYTKFLDQLIVLTIDSNNDGTKEKYKALLKSLCKKTPFNILDEWERAAKSSSIPRLELLASLRKNIEDGSNKL